MITNGVWHPWSWEFWFEVCLLRKWNIVRWTAPLRGSAFSSVLHSRRLLWETATHKFLLSLKWEPFLRILNLIIFERGACCLPYCHCKGTMLSCLGCWTNFHSNSCKRQCHTPNILNGAYPVWMSHANVCTRDVWHMKHLVKSEFPFYTRRWCTFWRKGVQNGETGCHGMQRQLLNFGKEHPLHTQKSGNLIAIATWIIWPLDVGKTNIFVICWVDQARGDWVGWGLGVHLCPLMKTISVDMCKRPRILDLRRTSCQEMALDQRRWHFSSDQNILWGH